jgi:hypothetical protein
MAWRREGEKMKTSLLVAILLCALMLSGCAELIVAQLPESGAPPVLVQDAAPAWALYRSGEREMGTAVPMDASAPLSDAWMLHRAGERIVVAPARFDVAWEAYRAGERVLVEQESDLLPVE